MLCVADYLDALAWVRSIGGLSAAIARSMPTSLCWKASLPTPLDSLFSQNQAERSNTSVCLTLDVSEAQVKTIIKLLEQEKVAFDVGAYRDAPPGLRIWCGATVETADLKALLPWIEWAYQRATAA